MLLGDRIVLPTHNQSKGHLFAFDTGSGELLWKVPFNYGVATTPLLVGGRLMVASVAGEVAAVDAASGRVLWRVTPFGTLQPTPFVQSPAFAANRIVTADNTDQILALNPADGAVAWRAKLPARANTSLVAVGSRVIVGTADRFLNWLDSDSGVIKQRVELGGIPHGTPVPAGELLLVLAGSGPSKLIALHAETGEIRWQQETSKEWATYRPLVIGSTVMVGNEDKDLCAFDVTSGVRRWCRAVGEVPRGLGISADGTLYVGGRMGVVQAFPTRD